MTELKGFEERTGREPRHRHRPRRQPDGPHLARNARPRRSELGTTRQPYCVIVGGGQGGIALGARLKRLDVPTIILESNARPGDSWRNRYKSLVLHDPVWYDHLPYLPFPDDWPIFTPKDKLADWLEAYVKIMELNYWGSSTCRERLLRRGRRANGPWSSIATARRWFCVPSSSSSPPAPTASRTRSSCRASSASRRDPAFERLPDRRALCGQAGHRDRRQYLRARHLRRPVAASRRRHHDPAFADHRRPMADADGAAASPASTRRRRCAPGSRPRRPTSCSPRCPSP